MASLVKHVLYAPAVAQRQPSPETVVLCAVIGPFMLILGVVLIFNNFRGNLSAPWDFFGPAAIGVSVGLFMITARGLGGRTISHDPDHPQGRTEK